MGFTVTFEGDRTVFRRVDVADIQELAGDLPIRQRMAHLLRGGPLTAAAIAERLDAKPDTIEKTAKRGDRKLFTRVPGPDGVYRIGLVERRSA